MTNIKDLLNQIIKMLKESSNFSQAEWIENQLLSLDDDSENTIKNIKAVIAGMGSLSDLYLTIPQSSSHNKSEYNMAYQELVRKLDYEIQEYLK